MTRIGDHDTSSRPSTRLEMEFWSVRQLRSASAPWGYDAVSKPQPVNRPAFNYKEACRGHGINTAYGRSMGYVRQLWRSCLIKEKHDESEYIGEAGSGRFPGRYTRDCCAKGSVKGRTHCGICPADQESIQIQVRRFCCSGQVCVHGCHLGGSPCRADPVTPPATALQSSDSFL